MQFVSMESIKTMNMDKIFDCIRLIDVQQENLCFEKYSDNFDYNIPKFNYNDRKNEYKRSINIDNSIYLPETDGNDLLLFILVPTSIENKTLIMECVLNLTSKLESSQLFINNNNLNDQINLSCFKDILYNLHNLAITDDLTGAYNRRYINKVLPTEIMKCYSNKAPLSVLFADLDSFKNINDSYGHSAGDYILCEFVKEIKKEIQHTKGWIARYGGDEFLICMPNVDKDDAKSMAEKIVLKIKQQGFEYLKNNIDLTCSIGTYTVDEFENMQSHEAILKEVDSKLYEMKKSKHSISK